MAEITTGIRSILSESAAYQFMQDMVGGYANRMKFVHDYLYPIDNAKILDVGCGPGNLLRYLPSDVDYVGIDLSQTYVETARSQYGDRGIFQVCDVSDYDYEHLGKVDIVVAKGLLHHLDDDEVVNLFRSAFEVMSENSRMITMDPCFHPGQSKIARFIISKDRGQNVRTIEQYTGLAKNVFPDVRHDYRTDLLRIPYSHCIMVCRKSRIK